MERLARKRFMDLALAVPGFIILLPLLAVLTCLVHFKLGRPILYCQERAGLHGKPFLLYKFRTMTEERDSQGRLLSDKDRITPFGSFLRWSSLDELPELFNVIKGDLSLVGPRPLLMRYLPCYTETEHRRHLVKPGITGWAQINGRNHLPWDDRLALDVWYVENWTLWLDFKILLLTFFKVAQGHGVSVDTYEVESDLEEERGGI